MFEGNGKPGTPTIAAIRRAIDSGDFALAEKLLRATDAHAAHPDREEPAKSTKSEQGTAIVLHAEAGRRP